MTMDRAEPHGARQIVCAVSALAAAVLAAPPSSPGQSRAVTPADETAGFVHLLQRATFGARPGDVNVIREMGADAWLDRQLQPDGIDDSGLESRLAVYPAASMSQAELYRAYPPPRVLRERFGEPDSVSTAQRREMRLMSPARIVGDLVGAKLQRAVYSKRQLEEVMVDFWFNHFNVFFAKGADRWLVADYERSAIRPNVFGRFEDLLAATARHPAMLFYLDNWRNVVPDSMNAGGRRRSGDRQRGYNENYARELLELHTLGVDGGYTQDDVVSAARALTGWTITRPGQRRDEAQEIEFRFVPQLHDPGPKEVLGQALPGGRSMADGEALLRLLARHPSTADHIARKLVERFVADEPPADAVHRVAAVFRRTDGDLREVTRAVLRDPAFVDPARFGSKIRSPFELVAASLRVTGAHVRSSRALVQRLRSFGHMPYLSDVPTGYPETSDQWVNSGAMLQRMNYALALAGGEIRGVEIEPEAGEEWRELEAGRDPTGAVSSMAIVFLPGVDTREIVNVIMDDLHGGNARGAEAVRRGAGLLLGSPEFQRH